jgi:hypothetical protein
MEAVLTYLAAVAIAGLLIGTTRGSLLYIRSRSFSERSCTVVSD